MKQKTTKTAKTTKQTTFGHDAAFDAEGFENKEKREVTTLTSIGYGDVVPISNTERAFCVFLMLISGIVWACILGNIAGLYSAMCQAPPQPGGRRGALGMEPHLSPTRDRPLASTLCVEQRRSPTRWDRPLPSTLACVHRRRVFRASCSTEEEKPSCCAGRREDEFEFWSRMDRLNALMREEGMAAEAPAG